MNELVISMKVTKIRCFWLCFLIHHVCMLLSDLPAYSELNNAVEGDETSENKTYLTKRKKILDQVMKVGFKMQNWMELDPYEGIYVARTRQYLNTYDTRTHDEFLTIHITHVSDCFGYDTAP